MSQIMAWLISTVNFRSFNIWTRRNSRKGGMVETVGINELGAVKPLLHHITVKQLELNFKLQN